MVTQFQPLAAVSKRLKTAYSDYRAVQRLSNPKKYYVGSGRYPLGFGFRNNQRNILYSKAGAASTYALLYEVYGCLHAIVNGINALEWQIVRYPGGSKDDSQREIIAHKSDLLPRHALQKAIRDFNLNNNMGMLETIAFDYTLFGEVYFEKTQNEFGTDRSIEWLNPLGAEPFYNREIEYFRYGWNNEWIQIPASRIAYTHNRNSMNDFTGQARVLTALDEVNVARNLDRFLDDFFSNNARPGMVIMPDAGVGGRLSKTDHNALSRHIRDELKGVGNQFNSIVLSQRSEIQTLEAPDLTKYSELNNAQSNAIFEVFGVPRALLGNTSNTTFKDGEETTVRFFLNTVVPLAKIMQDYINQQIMTHFDDSGLVILEFDTHRWDRQQAVEMLDAQIVQTEVAAGVIDLYNAARRLGIEPPEDLRNIYMINGVPVPLSILSTYHEKLLPAPVPPMMPGDNLFGANVQGGHYENKKVADREDKLLAKQDNMLDELNAWRRKTLKAWQKPFDAYRLPRHIVETVRAGIATSKGEKSKIIETFNKAEKRLQTQLEINEDAQIAAVYNELAELGFTEWTDQLDEVIAQSESDTERLLSS